MNTTQIAVEAADEITRISKLILLGAKPHTTVQSIIQTAIEKAKMEIWRTAPDQLDVQEAVINKLNLVSAESSAAHTNEDWKQKIADFVLAILHGDEVHQAWLREAGEAFITGNPLPAPRSAKDNRFACTVCGRGANEAGVLHRVSRKGGVKPVVWICREHFNYEDFKFVEDNDERLTRRAAHASEQGEAVPSNWCDDLLTGPDGIGKPPYNCIHIEKLLNGIRKRILQT